MFWTKKNKIDWPFLFFGLIVLGIIISVVILLVLLSKKVGDIQRQKTGEITSVSDVYSNIIPVKQNYLAKMTSLKESINSLKTTEEIYKELENVFLQARVPQDKLEAHLSAWLKIDNLRTDNKLKVDELKKEVGAVLDGLIGKNEMLE